VLRSILLWGWFCVCEDAEQKKRTESTAARAHARTPRGRLQRRRRGGEEEERGAGARRCVRAGGAGQTQKEAIEKERKKGRGCVEKELLLCCAVAVLCAPGACACACAWCKCVYKVVRVMCISKRTKRACDGPQGSTHSHAEHKGVAPSPFPSAPPPSCLRVFSFARFRSSLRVAPRISALGGLHARIRSGGKQGGGWLARRSAAFRIKGRRGRAHGGARARNAEPLLLKKGRGAVQREIFSGVKAKPNETWWPRPPGTGGGGLGGGGGRR
jgi:hypothetical protein